MRNVIGEPVNDGAITNSMDYLRHRREIALFRLQQPSVLDDLLGGAVIMTVSLSLMVGLIWGLT